jgi:hypothetical protein
MIFRTPPGHRPRLKWDIHVTLVTDYDSMETTPSLNPGVRDGVRHICVELQVYDMIFHGKSFQAFPR